MMKRLSITILAAVLLAVTLFKAWIASSGPEESTITAMVQGPSHAIARLAADSSLNPSGLTGFYFDGPTQMKESTITTITAANPAREQSLGQRGLPGFYFDGPTRMKQSTITTIAAANPAQE